MEQQTCKVRVVVVGRVQGVFYRQSTKDQAQRYGLSGWVRNEDNGDVALEAVGPKNAVEELVRWCHQGPPSARVDKVEVEWLEVAGETEALPKGFRVIQ
jgi:acylphosphatase